MQKAMSSKTLHIVYCIDLDTSRPAVLEFSGDELQFDLDHFGVKDPLELNTPDRKVFRTECEAERYLERYNEALACLKRNYRGQTFEAPCMLYKRRYLVQTFLGEKMSTRRTYKKNWKIGQHFNLHDQVLFLTVRLKSIQELRDEDGIYYRYHFERR